LLRELPEIRRIVATRNTQRANLGLALSYKPGLRLDLSAIHWKRRRIALPSRFCTRPSLLDAPKPAHCLSLGTRLASATEPSAGRPLDPGMRAFLEPRFGFDFSRVRIFSDEKAAESAQSIGALAYTVGTNIVFRRLVATDREQARGEGCWRMS
jgi:hypothetical protein